jgi:hypothetical protein
MPLPPSKQAAAALVRGLRGEIPGQTVIGTGADIVQMGRKQPPHDTFGQFISGQACQYNPAFFHQALLMATEGLLPPGDAASSLPNAATRP